MQSKSDCCKKLQSESERVEKKNVGKIGKRKEDLIGFVLPNRLL